MNRKKEIRIADDFPIMRKLLLIEQEIEKLFEKVLPKKFKFNLEQQTHDYLGYAKIMLCKAIDTPPLDEQLVRIKRDMLIESRSFVRGVEVNLCQINDLQGISNEAKSKIDILIYGFYKDTRQFLNSLNKKLQSGSDVERCGEDTVPNIIRMPDCDGRGGLNA